MAIQSIQKAIDILSLFSIEKPRRGITEIAKSLNLPITTVSSLVQTLKDVGLLEQDPETRKYGLGSKLFTLGMIVNETLEVNQRAAGPAHRLAEMSGLICRVAIWDYDAALVTLNATPRDAQFLAPRIGPRVAAYCSSIGRTLLAHLDPKELNGYLKKTKLTPLTPHTVTRRDLLRKELKQIREQGHAVNNQELSIGRASVAVPIFRSGGNIAASISLTGSPEKVLESDFENLLSILTVTAQEISREMGYRPESPPVNIGQRKTA
ncbi:MAG: IclR family transcriptional regulator [Deltaproteobacteria bacterium]|nr:IclR family transcriptional regulator [Deltaproteobacteria bacterium]MBW1944031.1 IclR family transcriptional regulator [Deltaproteobacteria bacterium]